jgi:hypothetical protein
MPHCDSTFRPRSAGRQSELDVGCQGLPRQQTRFLEHHGAARVDPAHGLAVDLDPPTGGTVETRDEPQ